jgi:hypothetical protein
MSAAAAADMQAQQIRSVSLQQPDLYAQGQQKQDWPNITNCISAYAYTNMQQQVQSKHLCQACASSSSSGGAFCGW